MSKKMYYFFIFALLLKLNASTTPQISAENILEIKFHSVCLPTRIAPETFNEVMKEMHSAAAVSSGKRFSSVDRALNALEKLSNVPGLEFDSEYVVSIKTLLMPFADFTRVLNRYRPVLVTHGEEMAPEDPLITNRERAFNILAAALFDFKDESTFETFKKAFSTGQTPKSVIVGIDGRILSFNDVAVDESTLSEQVFYPHVRQATAEFMSSILHIWESQFMRELLINKRVSVAKSKVLAEKHLAVVELVKKKPTTKPTEVPSLSAAASDKEDSDDGFVYVDGDDKGTAHFEPDPLSLVVKSTSGSQ